MATPIIMPKFEMAQETGLVVRWLKQPGAPVQKGEAILEVETDKVTMEVEAPASGILGELQADAGATVPIGQTIATILAPDESAPAAALPPPTAPTRATPVAERMAQAHGINLQQLEPGAAGSRITKADIAQHLSRVSSSSPTPPSPLLPLATGLALPAGGLQERSAAHQPENNLEDDAIGPGQRTQIKAVPAARRLARELGVDLHTVQGSGPEGRIQSVDVRQAAAHQPVAIESKPGLPPILDDSGLRLGDLEQPTLPPEAQPSALAIRRRITLTSMRRTIAERMSASVHEAPQFALGMEIDMERALAIIDDLRALPAPADAPKVTLTALLVRVCAWALQRHPRLNASFQETEIIEWADINIGVAISVEDGLLVPVVRQAERLTLAEIAAQLHDLSTRARLGALRPVDLRGGSFTISNLGMFGVDHFTAILNPPQAGILAVGRVAKRPFVLEDGSLTARVQATLTLTADHRVVDGVQAGRFLADVRNALEHPGVLL